MVIFVNPPLYFFHGSKTPFYNSRDDDWINNNFLNILVGRYVLLQKKRQALVTIRYVTNKKLNYNVLKFVCQHFK